MKIALGTAQWGMNYGISNYNGIPNDLEIKGIIELAKINKINYLDTASIYGNSEERIGKLNDLSFKITTKISSNIIKDSIKNQVDNSIKKLKQKHIYGCLFHDTKSLVKNKSIWNQLKDEKDKGRIQKIGYSVYDVEELNILLELNFIPDIIQLPYSCLDLKFESSLKKLKDLDVEIHARSIFLQGVYFFKKENLPKHLSMLEDGLSQMNKIKDYFNIKTLDLILHFVLKNKLIDKLVLGFENKKQLNEIITSINKTEISDQISDSVKKIRLKNYKILNPSNWKN